MRALEGELEMEQNKLKSGRVDKEIFWCVPSRHIRQNIFQYAYYRINNQSEVTTPANHNTNIIFVVDGSCCYEGTEVKKGDVFLYGMHKTPITSFSTNIKLFSIDVSYVFLYQKFGVIPAMYHEKALCLPAEHVICRFGNKLLQEPMERWVELSELFLEGFLSERTEFEKEDPYECVLRVAHNILVKGYPDDTDCCTEFCISRRHLQRRFIRFFGMTMRDYERILRFSRAFCQLDENSLVNTALHAGYYDQSHMNREFKQLAGSSPQQSAQHTIYSPLKEVRRNLEMQ